MTEEILIVDESADKTPSKVERFKKFVSTPKAKLIAAGTTVAIIGGAIAAVLFFGKDNSDFESDDMLESESVDSEAEII